MSDEDVSEEIPQEILDMLPVRCCKVCLEAAKSGKYCSIRHYIQTEPDEYYQQRHTMVLTHEFVEPVPPKKKHWWSRK